MNAYIAEALQEIECIHRFAGLTLREGSIRSVSSISIPGFTKNKNGRYAP
jgi:hypothetical protein